MSNNPFEVTIAGGEDMSEIVIETSFDFGLKTAEDFVHPNGELNDNNESKTAEELLLEEIFNGSEESEDSKAVNKITLAPGEIRIVRNGTSDKDQLTWRVVEALGTYCKNLRRQSRQNS